ncbi:hypothetical protein ACM66B_003605 [Microbotryomycetes sp. NB124-2]
MDKCTDPTVVHVDVADASVPGLTVVGGLDISFFDDFDSGTSQGQRIGTAPGEPGQAKPSASRGIAVLALLSFPGLELLHVIQKPVDMSSTPYIPSFLSFRESKPLSSLVTDNWDLLVSMGVAPDVLFVDGNGRLHTREAGSAVAVGLETGLPTVGVAKEYHALPTTHANCFMASQKAMRSMSRKLLSKRGDLIPITNTSGISIGAAVLTSPAPSSKNSVFVSPGHKISLETSVALSLMTCKTARVPEPVRMADLIGRELVREQQQQPA